MKIDFPPELPGRRIRLRRFGAGDVTDAYIGWLNDPAVTRYSNQRFVRHDRASAAAYLATFADGRNLFLTIRDRDCDRAVGTMTAYFSHHHGTVDVGILVGERTVWGTGVGQDAWDTLLDWLLTQPGVRKVTAGTLASNRGMIRIAERSAMVLEGRRAGQEIVDGEAIDILMFGRFGEG